jgi:hypothetical protein
MAESDLAKVVSLSAKAYELHCKAHWERCLEKWRAALAAAEALGAEDCLLVAGFKTELARAISDLEAAHKNFPFSQAVCLEILDLHAASATILRRRRAAGTLMAGKCRPIEVQWFFRFIQLTSPRDEVDAHSQAKLVGYDTFLRACCSFAASLSLSLPGRSLYKHGGESVPLPRTLSLPSFAISSTMQSRSWHFRAWRSVCCLSSLPCLGCFRCWLIP